MINKEGWEIKKMRHVVDFQNGFAFKSSLYKETGLPILRISNIQNQHIDLKNLVYFDPTEYKEKLDKFKVVKGDVVIAMSGATTGKLGINNTDEIYYLNQRVGKFIPKGEILKSYLYYYLSTKVEETLILASGVAQPNISSEQINSFDIPIPPLPIQQQIVSELDTLTEIITKKKQQLAELDNLAQATFYDMFGDPVTNEKGWEVKKLKQICTKLTDGTHFSPISTKEGVYKYVTAKNIKKDGFDFKNLTYISEKDHKEIYSRCNPEYGDILYIKDGATTGIAQINTLKDEFSLLSSVALLKFDRKIIFGYYLRDALNNESFYKFIRSNMGGVAITRLTIQKIKEFKLPIPSFLLQKQYFDKIEIIEKQKELIKKSINDTQLLFDYTMDKYFN